MKAALIALLAMAAAAPATPAAADAATDKSDVRCLLVLRFAARDEKVRDQAARGAHYFMGRLAARGPVSRLEPVMTAEGRAINSAALAQAEFKRCADELMANQTQFQTLDQKLAQSMGAAAKPPAK